MTNLNATAESRWADYIDEVRSALATLSQEQVEEIVSDLETHLESEETRLADPGQPLGEPEIDAVITRLGEPAALAEAYGIEPVKPGSIDSFSMSMLIASFFLIATAGFFPVMQIALIPGSAVLGRIALSQPGVMQSTYRWAAYPGLAAAYFLLILLTLFWTLIPVLPLAATGGILPQILIEDNASLQAGSVEYWARVSSLAFIVTGMWWLLLSRLLRNSKALLDQVFFPFMQLTRLPISKILVAGGLLQIAAAILVILIY